MTTSWRLRQTRGQGWIEAVVGGRPIVTGQAARAHQWPSREAAERAAAGFPGGLVPVVAVEGPAFDRAAPRQ